MTSRTPATGFARAPRRKMPALPARTDRRAEARGCRGSFKLLIQTSAVLAPLERALPRPRVGGRRVILRRGRRTQEHLTLLVRQNRKVRRPEIVGNPLGVGAGQVAAHAAMRAARIVHAQCRKLLAVENPDLRAEQFKVLR